VNVSKVGRSLGRLHARCNFKKLHLNLLFSPTPDATFWLMPFPWVSAPKKEWKRKREGRGGKKGRKKGGKKKKFYLRRFDPPPLGMG
jgi:hypothetical protein